MEVYRTEVIPGVRDLYLFPKEELAIFYDPDSSEPLVKLRIEHLGWGSEYLNKGDFMKVVLPLYVRFVMDRIGKEISQGTLELLTRPTSWKLIYYDRWIEPRNLPNLHKDLEEILLEAANIARSSPGKEEIQKRFWSEIDHDLLGKALLSDLTDSEKRLASIERQKLEYLRRTRQDIVNAEKTIDALNLYFFSKI